MNGDVIIVKRSPVSPSTAAKILEVGRTTVIRWIQDGTLSAFKYHGRGHWQVDYDSVMRLRLHREKQTLGEEPTPE